MFCSAPPSTPLQVAFLSACWKSACLALLELGCAVNANSPLLTLSVCVYGRGKLIRAGVLSPAEEAQGLLGRPSLSWRF